MQFCTKCGTALTVVKKERKIVLYCPKCGYVPHKPEKSVSKITPNKEKIVVIGKQEQKIRTLPKTKVECPKCSHFEA